VYPARQPVTRTNYITSSGHGVYCWAGCRSDVLWSSTMRSSTSPRHLSMSLTTIYFPTDQTWASQLVRQSDGWLFMSGKYNTHPRSWPEVASPIRASRLPPARCIPYCGVRLIHAYAVLIIVERSYIRHSICLCVRITRSTKYDRGLLVAQRPSNCSVWRPNCNKNSTNTRATFR